MNDALQQLRLHTTVVADTGDLDAISRYQPTDATTNPSLILKAANQLAGQALLDDVLASASPDAAADELADRLLVAFGQAILARIPGRVSTEVDARLSFDAPASIARARRIIGWYEAAGIDRQRVLIKLAATWEGIQAARVLQAEGIRCNLTLLFSLPQAVACAEAGVTLVSPFVGRIYDWHKRTAGADWDEAAHAGEHDPGVQSVRRIFQYYKAHGIATEIMGASFRNTGQIRALAGCDLLTISPELLGQLQQDTAPVPCALDADAARRDPPPRLPCDEPAFRYALNADAMACEKLAEGIRLFAADGQKLDALIARRRAG